MKYFQIARISKYLCALCIKQLVLQVRGSDSCSVGGHPSVFWTKDAVQRLHVGSSTFHVSVFPAEYDVMRFHDTWFKWAAPLLYPHGSAFHLSIKWLSDCRGFFFFFLWDVCDVSCAHNVIKCPSHLIFPAIFKINTTVRGRLSLISKRCFWLV